MIQLGYTFYALDGILSRSKRVRQGSESARFASYRPALVAYGGSLIVGAVQRQKKRFIRLTICHYTWQQ